VTFGGCSLFAAGLTFVAIGAFAADDPGSPDPSPVLPAIPDQHIMGVIPDYQTVRDSKASVAPLTARQKWGLALKETIDPFNIATAAMTAGFSQAGNQTPKYGFGARAYGERFGAALADFGTQNFFSAGVLATVLHQDPRYFREGPDHSILHRILYCASRVVVARQDSGANAFNASGVGGVVMGIAASNFYYPGPSRRGTIMAERLETSLFGNVTGNLMSEFWPDIEKKFFHRHKQP
jgi:hypothetical protein